MADDTKIRQPQDPKKVNVNQPHEVRWWCRKWGITEQQLREAVTAVGVDVDDVEEHLRDQDLI